MAIAYTCRACGAPIVWIKTPAGKDMPCDATPVFYQAKKNGRQKIVTKNGEVIACEIVSDPDKATGTGYIPHWGNCSAPDKFRKGKKEKQTK